MASLGDTVAGQGLVGVCRFLDQPLSAVLEREARLIVLLAHIRDPGNAGSVLRAADAAGADAVVLTNESVDVYNPASACRARRWQRLFHLPVWPSTSLPGSRRELRRSGTARPGRPTATGAGRAWTNWSADQRRRWPSDNCWMFGNEAWGLPEPIRALVDETVRVPIHGRAESLNLATAAAVCLYASARAQRR